MRTLSVVALRGGTGKTTTAVNVSAALADAGVPVELVDLDPQGSATLALGFAPVPDPWNAEPVPIGTDGRLFLRRGGRAHASASVRDVLALLHLEDHAPAALRVVDCPPSLGAATVAALEAAAVVLVPLEPSPLSLPGFVDIAAVLAELKRPPVLRAVLSRVHARRAITAEVEERLADAYPGVLYGVHIPEDARANEAPGFGVPVLAYAPRSRAAEAFRRLAELVAADLDLEGAK